MWQSLTPCRNRDRPTIFAAPRFGLRPLPKACPAVPYGRRRRRRFFFLCILFSLAWSALLAVSRDLNGLLPTTNDHYAGKPPVLASIHPIHDVTDSQPRQIGREADGSVVAVPEMPTGHRLTRLMPDPFLAVMADPAQTTARCHIVKGAAPSRIHSPRTPRLHRALARAGMSTAPSRSAEAGTEAKTVRCKPFRMIILRLRMLRVFSKTEC